MTMRRNDDRKESHENAREEETLENGGEEW